MLFFTKTHLLILTAVLFSASSVCAYMCETTVHLSCTAAQGKNTEPDITEAIWKRFTTRDVKRKDGTPLHYYKNPKRKNVLTGELLKDGDGQCGAWTKFFLDCLKVQGINTNRTYITLGWAGESGRGKGLLIKDWVFSGTDKSGREDYPYINIFHPSATFDDIKNQRNMLYSEVKPAKIISGQNNKYTSTYFMNHQLAYVNGSFKDPSYGISSADPGYEKDDSNFMLSGYMMITSHTVNENNFGRIDLNGNGTIDEKAVVKAVLFRKQSKNWATPHVSNY